MRNIVNTYIDRFRHQRRTQRRVMAVLLALAVVVAGGVFWQLRYTGVAMANDTYCGCEEHTHDESCYEQVLTCGLEEEEAVEGHIHTADCYETVQTLVCGLEESEGHSHDESCFDEEGNLICELEESEGHTHDESCCEEEPVLVCDQEEEEAVEGHTHDDSCYEEVLVCEIPEHTHTIECMSDEKADVETAKDWEATLPELTGVWADDVVAIAQSQIGYTESEKNFQYDEETDTQKGYTRYGAWYGNEYGDWCAMFASFCLHYAGVPESEFPEDAGVYAWMTDLKKLSRYADAADYTPVPGDIIFFDNDGNKEADHVGIVEEVNSKGDKIKTIEGNSSDKVKENSYSASDKAIVGYGILPEQGESKEVSGPEVPYDTPSLTEQTVEAQILSNESAVQTMSASASESVILSGLLPENATVTAVPVDVQIGDMTILAAYDITICDENGYEFEPEDGQIHVTICNSAIRSAMDQGAEPVVYHINDETSALENVDVTAADDGAVEFNAESFSIYIVGENDQYYLPGDEENAVTVYTVEFYQYEFDATDNTAKGPTKTSTQFVTEADTLNEPAVPEYEHHVFDGWFTEMQISAENEPGNKFDFSATLGENLTAWGDDYELQGHHTIALYTDYDPIYYVYFMTEEDPKLEPNDENYEPYVFHTDTYHENNSALDTTTADTLYWQQFLQVEQDTGDLVTYAVVDWYYYDSSDPVADTDGKVLISDKVDIDGYFHITDDIKLYPVVDEAIWIYFEMCITDSSEVYIEPSPAYVKANADTVGEGTLPEAVRPGYTFNGWYTEEDGKGVKVDEDTAFTTLKEYASKEDGTVTLYAYWTPTTVGYTINIWRQKATDGQKGLDQKVVESGEQYEEYIQYYDYAESITIDADDARALTTGSTGLTYQDFGSYTTGQGSSRQTVYYWNDWTGYGWTSSSDGTGYYVGFEYNETRTLNDLATITVQPDGSTIINIFYDRVTITYSFTGGSENGTLIGLYDTNITPTNGSNAGGSLDHWPSAGTNRQWRFQTSRNGYTGMSFLAKFTLEEDNYSNRSNEVSFSTSTVSGTATLYYYLEVTNPEKQLSDSSQTIESGEITYVLDQTVSVPAQTFYFTDKYIGYEFYGSNTDGGTSIDTTRTSRTLSNNSQCYIFNKAIEYTIELYSNHNGEQLVWSNKYKYGEPLSSVELPTELDAAEYGPAYYYQFTGTWWEDPTFTAEFIKPDTMPANNLVAYADWEPKNITVTFVSLVESDLYDLLVTAYGVYDEVNNPGGVNVVDNGTDSNSYSYSIVITASDSVSETLASLIAKGTSEDSEGGTIENSERYTFVSWMNGSSIFNVSGHLYDDTTLVASWNDSEKEHHKLYYVINLDGYAGTKYWTDGVEHAVDAESGEEVCLLQEAFNEDNTGAALEQEQIDKFICWNTEADGSGTDYYPEDVYSFAGVHTDQVLYAKWATELKSTLHVYYNYPGNYDENNKDEHPDVDITVDNLGTVNLGQDEEEEDGYYFALHEGDEIEVNGVTYRFVGWSTNQYATSAEIPADATVAVDGSDTTDEEGEVTRINELYAVWLAETQFTILKTNANGEKLEGAEFTLTYTVTEGEGDDTTTTTYYYSYDTATGNGSWSTTYNTITLDTISFHDSIGSLDGNETFTLTEVTPPEGYLEIESPITFTFNANDATISITSGEYDSEGVLQATASFNTLTVIDPSDSFDVYIRKYTGDYESTPPGSYLDADDDDEPSYIALSGAEFVLSRTVTGENGEQSTEYAVFEYTDENGFNVYELPSWTEDISKATTLTSDGYGWIEVHDLQVGTYTLTETKAPDGYMLLSEDIVFTVNADGSVTVDDKYADEYSNNLIVIGNDAGTELPNTGGPGTWMYILTGLVMMSGAGFLSYRKKRSEVRA